MNDNSWDNLVNLIDEKYTIDNSERLTEKLEDDGKLTRTIERIDFERDNQKFRIERVESPMIIDKKTFYHQRGTADHAKFVYDPEETSKKVFFYRRLPDGNYNEITPEELMS